MSIKVIKAGLQTTIQDLGRPGLRQYGIASNGALDEYSHQLANWLVGKEPHEATIEVTQIGPTLEFTQPMTIGITGAEFELSINDIPCPMNQTLQLNEGDTLKFGKLKSGARAYLAFSGSLNLRKIMKSHSTNLLAAFGGYKGRALQDNDYLRMKPIKAETNATKIERSVPQALQQEHHHNLQQRHLIVRVIKGKEFAELTEDSQNQFLQTDFEVNSYSNRMAIKFDGERLITNKELSIVTTPITIGTIQLPPNGQPIVTLADGQTTGGYPRVGQVITADVSLLAQLKAGDSLSFYPVTIEQALDALKQKNKYVDSVLETPNY